jgi:carbamoylphosphate synthase small subunit
MKKMTKREKFEMIANIEEVKASPILSEFVAHELELLAKKNTSEKKPTAVQVANEGLKQTIMDVLMANGGLMTITDIQKSCEELSELSNQKVTALIRQLKEDGKVEKIEDKRKSYFKAY